MPMLVDRAEMSVKLMLRVKDGDKDAFSLLYDEHHRRVLNFFYRLSADAQLAKDLRQETFLRIWKIRGAIGPRARSSRTSSLLRATCGLSIAGSARSSTI